MKHLHTLQLLFSAIILLLICIISALLFNKSEPEGFYCGVTTTPVEYQEIDDEHLVGKELFKSNCKSCHKRYEASVGPALFGITKKRPRKWIYAFVHNSQELIDSGDTMAVNVYNQYNSAAMTAFPVFTEAEIDSILTYIESASRPLPRY